MLFRVLSTELQQSFILQKTDYNYVTKTKISSDDHHTDDFDDILSRSTTELGTDDYKRSLRRAFTRAKLLAFFNPDLTEFITLTYKKNMKSHIQAMKDFKLFIKKEKYHQQINNKIQKSSAPSPQQSNQNTTELSTFPQDKNKKNNITPEKINKTSRRPCGTVDNSFSQDNTEAANIGKRQGEKQNTGFKYIYVFERQERGAIHIHMIASKGFQYQINNNGHLELKNWSHGFSSVLTIKDFDNNFKPYLYLFKYMSKAQRIGASFIHTSRNVFDKIITIDYDKVRDLLNSEDLLYKEDFTFKIEEKDYTISKEYFRKTN